MKGYRMIGLEGMDEYGRLRGEGVKGIWVMGEEGEKEWKINTSVVKSIYTTGNNNTVDTCDGLGLPAH